MSYLAHAFSAQIGIFHSWIFLLQMVSAVALIGANDWYKRKLDARTKESIDALDALFALPDLRD